jgi:GNAT superfamily N-acetyltransferase
MAIQIIRTRHPPEPLIAQIAELTTQSGRPTAAPDVARRVEGLAKEDRILMAVDGELLIGYAHLRVSHDLAFEDTAVVAAIVVRESHRRHGVGRTLIAAAETWARESGRARLLLRTDVVRTPAHAFFVALGYEQASTTLEFVRDLGAARRADAPTVPI